MTKSQQSLICRKVEPMPYSSYFFLLPCLKHKLCALIFGGEESFETSNSFFSQKSWLL